MVALAPLEWQVMSCKEADCAGKCILGPSLCLCCRDFGGFGLSTPTSSHSPSGALLKCFWAEQSSLHCWDHAAMEADLGEWGQQQDFLQKLLPSRTSPLPPASQHGWWKQHNLWEKNWALCKKNISCQVFFFFVHLWVHENIANPPTGVCLVTANAGLLTKGLLFLCTFCRLFRRPSWLRHPQLRITSFSLLDQICEQQSSVQFDGSKIIHTCWNTHFLALAASELDPS